MDQATFASLLKFLAAFSPTLLFWMVILIIATPFGVVMLVMTFYWANERKQAEMMHVYREDMRMILKSYGDDIAKLSKFYDDNVKLVEAWEKIATGFQDQVILNTQTMQKMIDVCINNQFCPNARVPK